VVRAALQNSDVHPVSISRWTSLASLDTLLPAAARKYGRHQMVERATSGQAYRASVYARWGASEHGLRLPVTDRHRHLGPCALSIGDSTRRAGA
jgi:hypothetical protein